METGETADMVEKLEASVLLRIKFANTKLKRLNFEVFEVVDLD